MEDDRMMLNCFRCPAIIPITEYILHGQVLCPEIERVPVEAEPDNQPRTLACFQCKEPVVLHEYMDHLKLTCPEIQVKEEEIAAIEKQDKIEKERRRRQKKERKREMRLRNAHRV